MATTPTPILNNVRLMQETSVVHPHRTLAYHGETVNFTVDFRSYGAQVDLTGAEAALYWRVPSDEDGYWHQATATCTGSTAAWSWDATMDNGESPVTWFLQIVADDSNDTTSYRATGEIKLLESPGFVPAVVPPARITLDFDYVDVLHAPYYTKQETDTALGAYVPKTTKVNNKALSGDIELSASDVGALPSSYTPPVTSVNGDTGAVQVTPASIGALPVDPDYGGDYDYGVSASVEFDNSVFLDPDYGITIGSSSIGDGSISLPDGEITTDRITANVIGATVDVEAPVVVAEQLNNPNNANDAVLSVPAISADDTIATAGGTLPATPYTQGGATNTWQLPQGASIIPDTLLNITASNIVTTTIRGTDNGYALVVPDAQTNNDAVARLSDLPATETWTFTLSDNSTVNKVVSAHTAPAVQGN